MLNFSLIYVNICFFASLLSLVLFGFIWQKRQVVGSKYLLMAILAVAVYNLSYAFEYSATTEHLKVFWAKGEYTGLYNLVPLLLLFVVEYFGVVKKIKIKYVLLLWLIPIVILALAWTNELHGLIWINFSSIDPVTNLMIFGHGPVYMIGLLYLYGCMGVILFLLIKQWSSQRQPSFRHQIEIFILAIVLPFGGNIIYNTPLNPIPGMDWSPIASLFSLVLLSFAISAFRFLDLIPVAHDVVFSLIQDGIVVADSQGRIVDWNPTLVNLLPYLPLKTGMPAKQLFQYLGQDQISIETIHEPLNVEIEMNEPELIILDAYVTPLLRNNKQDGWLLIFDNETERRLANRALEKTNRTLIQKLDEIEKLKSQLEDQAIRDPLTALFNRRFFDEYFSNELVRSKRDNEPISLFMIDIDHFKSVNDRFGHDVGDQVLQLLADILKTMFRKSDVSCRLGGEEFLVLLPGLMVDQAFTRAEDLRNRFEQATREAEFLYSTVTISIGISNYPQDADNTHDMFRLADQALYRAKELGRNQVCCLESDM